MQIEVQEQLRRPISANSALDSAGTTSLAEIDSNR